MVARADFMAQAYVEGRFVGAGEPLGPVLMNRDHARVRAEKGYIIVGADN